MDALELLKQSPVKACAIEAIVQRANGYREDLGRIAYWDKSLLRRLQWKIGLKRNGPLYSAIPMLILAEPGMRHGDLRGLISIIPLPVLAVLQVNTGRAIVTGRLIGATPSQAEPKYMGWGTGSGTTAAGDTSLFFETFTTTNDGTHNIRP